MNKGREEKGRAKGEKEKEIEWEERGRKRKGGEEGGREREGRWRKRKGGERERSVWKRKRGRRGMEKRNNQEGETEDGKGVM